MRHQEELVHANFRRPTFPADESSVFYRMIMPSIIQDKKLKIPGKFTKKFANELPPFATLATPNGFVWRVGLRRFDNKVWLTDGWHEFVEHHSIREGYLLVFMYEGHSSFGVKIYDMANAEIKYQSNTLSSFEGLNCANRYKEEAEDKALAEILNSCPPWQTPPASSETRFLEEFRNQQKHGKSDDLFLQSMVKSPFGFDLAKNLDKPQVRYVQYAERNFNGGNLHEGIVGSGVRRTRDIGVQCSDSELPTSAYEIRLDSLNQTPAKNRKRKRGSGSSELESSAKHGREVKTLGGGTSCGSFLRSWRVITPEEKEKVLNAAKTFQSEYPFCRVILRRSYVYKGIGLHMPSSFAEKYLSGAVSGFVTLQVSSNGEKWPVRCMWRDGSAKLSKGWLEFVRDNKLEEGDACVFELIKMVEVVLKVTIFRISEIVGLVNHFPSQQNLPISH